MMNDPSDQSFPLMQGGMGVFFVIFLGVIAVSAMVGISRWMSNESSPILTITARAVTKRTNVSRRAGTMGTPGTVGADGVMSGGIPGTSGSTSTTYFVTFEDVASGERHELRMRGHEYGMIAEGDVGTLTYQGTRYQGFSRTT